MVLPYIGVSLLTESFGLQQVHAVVGAGGDSTLALSYVLNDYNIAIIASSVDDSLLSERNYICI